MHTQPLRAAIYARISEADPEVDKVAQQVIDCRALAEREGYEVVAVHEDDNVSAYQGKAERPGFLALLAGLGAGRYDVVLATEYPRLTRGSAVEAEQLQALTLKADGFIHLVRGGIMRVDSAQSRMMLGFIDLIGGLEVGQKTERQLAANKAKTSRGEALKGGKRRFGFEASHTEIRESEAVHIRWAYEQLLAGKSLYSIQKAFNQAGVVGAYGHAWDATKVRQMLQRPANAGILIHRGIEAPSSNIPAVVDRATYDAAMSLLADPGRRLIPGPNTRVNYLTGITYCGVCGSVMRSATNTQRGKTVHLYKCSAKADGRNQGERHPSIRRSLIEDRVAGEVFLWILNHPEAEEESNPNLTPLLLEIAEVNRQKATAMELALMPGAILTQTARMLKDLDDRVQALEARADRERADAAKVGVLAQVRDGWSRTDWNTGKGQAVLYKPGLEEWNTFWANLEIDQKREVVKSMLRVVVNLNTPGVQRVAVEWL